MIVCGAPDHRSPLAALAQPPSDTTHVSVTKPLTPTLPPFWYESSPLPPTTLCPLLPPPPFPPSSWPGPSGPCQQHLPFRFPVHRLHWSCHSLSPYGLRMCAVLLIAGLSTWPPASPYPEPTPRTPPLLQLLELFPVRISEVVILWEKGS